MFQSLKYWEFGHEISLYQFQLQCVDEGGSSHKCLSSSSYESSNCGLVTTSLLPSATQFIYSSHDQLALDKEETKKDTLHNKLLDLPFGALQIRATNTLSVGM